MSSELALVGIAMDTSSVETGERVSVKAFANIEKAADKMATSTDKANASTLATARAQEVAQQAMEQTTRAQAAADQTTKAHTATVEQYADGNTSSIIQNGTGNTATVGQYSDGNMSTINQSGTNNAATVTQGTAMSVNN